MSDVIRERLIELISSQPGRKIGVAEMWHSVPDRLGVPEVELRELVADALGDRTLMLGGLTSWIGIRP